MPISPFSPLTAADYDAIEAAVMETNRGRWFLSEFAHRNRHADTLMLLTAMERLENVVRGERAPSVDRLRAGLVDMAEVIDPAKADIAALEVAPTLQPNSADEDEFPKPATIVAKPVTALAALSAEEKLALFS
jgi:hypothetical protein